MVRLAVAVGCCWKDGGMDPIWLLVILILVVVFSSISIVGALHRIRDASEKTLEILEAQTAIQDPGASSH